MKIVLIVVSCLLFVPLGSASASFDPKLWAPHQPPTPPSAKMKKNSYCGYVPVMRGRGPFLGSCRGGRSPSLGG